MRRAAQRFLFEREGRDVLSGEHLKAARMLLHWKQSEVADVSGISLATIKRLEAIRGSLTGNVGTLIAVREALEDAGVRFIDSGTEMRCAVRKKVADGPRWGLVRP